MCVCVCICQGCGRDECVGRCRMLFIVKKIHCYARDCCFLCELNSGESWLWRLDTCRGFQLPNLLV